MALKVKLSLYMPAKPLGFQEFENLRFPDNLHMKVGALLALSTGHLYPSRK
jgi:hypothetical protein